MKDRLTAAEALLSFLAYIQGLAGEDGLTDITQAMKDFIKANELCTTRDGYERLVVLPGQADPLKLDKAEKEDEPVAETRAPGVFTEEVEDQIGTEEKTDGAPAGDSKPKTFTEPPPELTPEQVATLKAGGDPEVIDKTPKEADAPEIETHLGPTEDEVSGPTAAAEADAAGTGEGDADSGV